MDGLPMIYLLLFSIGFFIVGVVCGVGFSGFNVNKCAQAEILNDQPSWWLHAKQAARDQRKHEIRVAVQRLRGNIVPQPTPTLGEHQPEVPTLRG